MNTEIPLSKLISILRHFNNIDRRMQVSTILTLLEVAQATEDDRPLTSKDLEDRIGYPSGTATRNTYYWEHGDKQMAGGGHGLVDVLISKEDRRYRDLKLNRKGKAFLNSVLR